MKKIILAALAVLTLAAASGQTRVSETRYDWSGLSRQIVGSTTDKQEQAYKIYRWLCDNIAYDTSYTIYHSDECFENRRGVCQAYSELFYRLAEPAGLKVDIVSGKSKDRDGSIGDTGHAWVFVYITDTSGILVDPTWGAGSVNGKTFTRNDHDDSWFAVDPYWMIFSHLPDPEMEEYQLLPEADRVDFETFRRLPSYRPDYAAFGQNGRELFRACMAGRTPDLPAYYPSGLAVADINNLPLEGTLHVGRYYDFAIRQRQPVRFMIRNGQRDYTSETWQKIEGHDVCRFMPSEAGELSVSVKRDEDDMWNVLAKYKVAAPTASEIAALEAAEPQHSPVWRNVDNFDAETLAARRVNIASLLKLVKAQHIKELPTIYSNNRFAINSIPWNGTLHVGQTYTFRITPYEGTRWAVINDDDWYLEWEEDNENPGLKITVTPKKAGELLISVEREDKPNSFSGCIEYKVVN